MRFMQANQLIFKEAARLSALILAQEAYIPQEPLRLPNNV